MIDITMTATRRPKVIDRTLKSFTKHIFKNQKDYRLIINIDPVGEDVKNNKIIDICEKYFEHLVIIEPKTPSFSKAVIRVWKETKSEYIFHLEDDWFLERDIDIKELIYQMNYDNNLACIRFYKEKIPETHFPTMFDCIYEYQPEKNLFFPMTGTCNSLNQFGLNPVLIRKKFIDESLLVMCNNKNPEKQFRENNPKMKNILKRWIFSIYGNPGDPRLVFDIGSEWRLNSKFKKPRTGTGFTTWDLR